MGELELQLLFALGGGVGAVLRHLAGQTIRHDLPLATLVVNFVGCALLGIWLAQTSPGSVSQELALGFCGGFTTYSSFAQQTWVLARERSLLLATGNVVLNFGLCALGFWAGLSLAV